MLIPIKPPAETENLPDEWANLDGLAAEIGTRWPAGVSAVEAVSEGRE